MNIYIYILKNTASYWIYIPTDTALEPSHTKGELKALSQSGSNEQGLDADETFQVSATSDVFQVADTELNVWGMPCWK